MSATGPNDPAHADLTSSQALDDRSRRFLEAPRRFGVLATINADGTPHQAVVWFLVEIDALIVNSLVGRRWPDNLLRDPRCSLTVEAGWDYVTVRGVIDVIDDPEQAQAHIAAMAHRYHDAERAAEMIERRFRPQRRISFRLRPASVTVHGGLD